MSSEGGHPLESNSQPYIGWTKLTIPQQSSTYLKRPRLIDEIHNKVDCKLVLIRAPAGYGKTSLLVDLAHETDLQVCWFTVEEQDSDLSVFLTYLIASIARRFPAFGQRSTQTLESMGNEIHDRLRVFATTLADEIYRVVPEYFFLILDDYHTLKEESHVHEFIRLLLDFAPEQCHLIISSRSVPPLPLIRLMARQQMAALGVDDLRFSESEIQSLTSHKFSINLSPDQIRFLAQQTDGWITAIWLSADMGWDAFLRGNLYSTSGLTETGIYDYLMSEVLTHQPEEIRHFLMHTAVLREMTAPVCAALLGRDCRDILSTLVRRNLFISRVEEVGIETTYKYHPLFRDLLLSRLRDQSEALFRRLNAKAADIYREQQDWQAVIFHDLQAGRFAQVRQTILAHFDELNRAGRRESVARWIDDLPPDQVTPDLQLKRAVLATHLGQADTALRLLTNAIVLFESEGKETGWALALIERSLALARTGRYSDGIEDCQQALTLLGQASDLDALRGRAYRYLAQFHGETGDPDTALHYLSRAYECWEQCNEPSADLAFVAQHMGVVYEMRGQFAEALDRYAAALSVWSQLEDEGRIAFTLNSIGVVYHRLGEYKTALQTLQDALQKSQDVGYTRAEAYTLASLADLYSDLGQFEQAIALYEQAYGKAQIIADAYLCSLITSVQAEALCRSGQIEGAQAEIERALSRNTLSRSYEARCRITLASTYVAQQQPERARQELDQVLVQLGAQSDLAFRGYINLAEVAMLQDHPQETSSHLHTAFRMAQQAGLTQPLVVESLNHMPVLRFAAKAGDKSEELDRWIAAAQELEEMRKQLADEYTLAIEHSRYPELRIYALGGSTVLQDGAPASWRATQAKELFFYLLTHPTGQTKEQIGATIWPDHSKSKLFSIFRSSLFRVRKALFADAVLFDEDLYRLNPQIHYYCDVHEFEREISKGDLSDNAVQKAYHYRRATEIYKGPFLADLYADWVTQFREGYQARYLQALTFLAEFHLERERFPQAIEFARRILSADEYYEVAYYSLIRAYARSGQRPQAKRVYTQCREMLAEFGLSPQKTWEELCR